MSREAHFHYAYVDTPTLYYVIRQPSTGKVWNVASEALETWGTLGRDADDYDIAATHRGGGFWTVDIPSSLPAAEYTLGIYLQGGASPADTDYPVAEQGGRWTGTQWLTTFDLFQGPGQTLVTLTVRTTGGTALQGISVWLSDQDDESTQIVYPRTTDSSGQVTFYLSLDQTYYVFCGHNNYSFADANVTPTSGTTSFTLDIATELTPSVGDGQKTCAEMVTRVLHLVGRYTTQSTMPVSEIILDGLNEAMRKIAERVPNCLDLHTESTTDFQISEDDYEIDLTDLSTRPWHVHRIWLLNGLETYEIHFKTPDWFGRNFPVVSAISSAAPEYWTRLGDTIRFNCPFASDYEDLYLRVDYTKRPTRFTATDSTQTCDFYDADDGIMMWAEARALRAIAKGNGALIQAAKEKEGQWEDWLNDFESMHDLETDQNLDDVREPRMYEDELI